MAESESGEAGLAPRPGSVAWVAALCASRAFFSIWFVAYAGVLPLLQTAWHLSSREAGLVQSAWQFGFLISMFIVGFLSDRFGAKRIFLATGVAAALSPMAFALLADGFWSAWLLHGLTGLCAGGTYAPVLALINEHVDQTWRGRAMGLMLASSSASFALCFMVIGLTLKFTDWRGALIAVALFPVLAWIIALVTMRKTDDIIHPRPAGERAWTAMPAILANKKSMLSILGYSFHNWELLGMWAWLPAFLTVAVNAHGSGTAAALSISLAMTALTYIANIGGSLAGGAMADSWGRTKTIFLWSCISAVLSCAIGWFIALPLPFLVVLACLYNFSAIADSSTHSTVLAESVPPHMLGASYSLRSVLGFGAGAMSPTVFGATLDFFGGTGGVHAWGIAWTTLGAVAMLGPVATWILHRTMRVNA
jgi:MFS family permease